MADRTVTIALDRYDRHIPFFLGSVEPPAGIGLRPLEVGMVPPRRDGIDRHRRMLVDMEFDVAEVSLASYIMARRQGAPITAVPCFPRRLFSQNHIFVNNRSGIRSPSDLPGRRVAIWAFQVTMSVLAKGDLQEEYGVPWQEVIWVTQRPEEIPWSFEGGNIERMRSGATGAELVLSGEVDAYIDPHPPEEIFADGRVSRLFDDTPGECVRYWKKNGYYPIMHLLAMKQALVEELPAFPQMLMDMWENAMEQTHEFYVDHNFTILPFGRYAYQDYENEFGEALWPSGLERNRKNLEMFVRYMHNQKLLPEIVPVDSFFHESVLTS